MTETFEVGDRVRLKPETAGEWLDQKFNRAAKSGRAGTVRAIYGTACLSSERSYMVLFDAVRKGLPELRHDFRARWLERVEIVE